MLALPLASSTPRSSPGSAGDTQAQARIQGCLTSVRVRFCKMGMTDLNEYSRLVHVPFEFEVLEAAQEEMRMMLE